MSLLFTRLPWFCFLVFVVVVVVVFFFSFLPVELICQLPRRLSYLALLLVSRRNSIISPFLQPAYVVILLLPRSVVRGSAVEVIVAGTCSCRGLVTTERCWR